MLLIGWNNKFSLFSLPFALKWLSLCCTQSVPNSTEFVGRKIYPKKNYENAPCEKVFQKLILMRNAIKFSPFRLHMCLRCLESKWPLNWLNKQISRVFEAMSVCVCVCDVYVMLRVKNIFRWEKMENLVYILFLSKILFGVRESYTHTHMPE